VSTSTFTVPPAIVNNEGVGSASSPVHSPFFVAKVRRGFGGGPISRRAEASSTWRENASASPVRSHRESQGQCASDAPARDRPSKHAERPKSVDRCPTPKRRASPASADLSPRACTDLMEFKNTPLAGLTLPPHETSRSVPKTASVFSLGAIAIQRPPPRDIPRDSVNSHRELPPRIRFELSRAPWSLLIWAPPCLRG